MYYSYNLILTCTQATSTYILRYLYRTVPFFLSCSVQKKEDPTLTSPTFQKHSVELVYSNMLFYVITPDPTTNGGM